ncbi:MAG: DUF481 domain-containing protein [Gammaproteobacteria bacterium]|nr:DUF481 domain-containing protein [Gammaproteobacteria bacterium]
MSRHPVVVGLVLTFLTAPSLADTVVTLDGAHLTGTVSMLTPTTLTLDTSYAGTIAVQMSQVQSMQIEESITARLEDDTMVTGVATLNGDGALHIANETLTATTPLSKVRAAWRPGATPPPESGIAAPRRWVYSVGADIVGKSGNSDEMTTNFVGDMALVTKDDELRMYASYQRAETESVETSDESILGASYTAFMYDPWGWYVRGELERDAFEDIDLRTSVAAGLTYRPINTQSRVLRLWSGLGYRHESFESGVDESSPTLDVGLSHRWIAKPWLTLNNELSVSPSVDDFGDYLFVHDSSMEMPVGASRWLIRLGLRNDYKSKPAPDRDELDTTYYTRLFLRFD